MDTQGTKVTVIATIVVIAVASSAIVLINLPNQENSVNTSGINSIYIIGNTTDIIYPELMEATFTYQSSEGWEVTANFLDNSEGWDYPEIYDRTFSVTNEEVKSIDDALSASLNLTSETEGDLNEVLVEGVHIGYHIVITYNDGAWIAIWTLLTETGHLLYNSGVGSPNLGMNDATFLEPISAMDNFVAAINTVFSDNLNT